jgi:molybdopterin molybdotransferase
MRGFASRVTVDDALTWLDGTVRLLPPEPVPLAELAGRVLAQDVSSEVDVPGFRRSMMDGFALRAADTMGAASYNRLPLRIVGQVLPGHHFEGAVGQGQAVRIMTGAPIPTGADAVLPVEKVEVGGDRLYALSEVSPGKHVGRIGEDIAKSSVVLCKGRKLRPQDIGVLSSIGVAEADAVRRPRVRIVVTGNELLPLGSKPSGSKIVDANSPMLASLITRDGGIAINPGIVPDDPDAILDAMQDDADVVLVSGGSSVGQEDHAPMLVANHGELAIHGIAMRPSSPTGMGRLGHRLVFLLPGNPVSCLCAYDFLAGRSIRAMAGLSKQWPYRQLRSPLRRKLVSVVGRVDYARVKLIDGQVEPLAISGASVLSSTTRADGFVVVSADSEGHPPGSEVVVWLYD